VRAVILVAPSELQARRTALSAAAAVEIAQSQSSFSIPERGRRRTKTVHPSSIGKLTLALSLGFLSRTNDVWDNLGKPPKGSVMLLVRGS
jgi:hypothetical protein